MSSKGEIEMNMIKTLSLIKKYGNCPACGNGNVANGEGKLIVEDKTFYRNCKCGWEIKTDENGKMYPKLY